MDGEYLNPRVVVWVFAQLHLLFAAFVLAVPMFALLIEFLGWRSKDPATSKRLDDLAHEFVRLLATAFSATAILGAIFTFACLAWYPNVIGYLSKVFGPTMFAYACVFFGESFSLYLWYYGWERMRDRKVLHLGLGVLLNVFGVVLLFLTSGWTAFMMSPAGVEADGTVVDAAAAMKNALWMPLNIHRLIANLCLGGSVAGAYAAIKFLTASSDEQRAHYDWMGYIGNFVAILALLPLPFAGYWLGLEIYQYNQQLGVTMMGGIFSWLFIVQAILIGGIFLSANYYLWLGMDRIDGSERYRGWSKWLLGIIALCFMIWATPHSLLATATEQAAMGGSHHPVLGVFGVMSAKNTAVNFMILATFLTFLLYRRGNKEPTVSWARHGKRAQVAIFAAASAMVLFIGIRGYVDVLGFAAYTTEERVAASPWQVLAVLFTMVSVLAIDVAMLRGAKEIGPIRWGRIPRRSQFALLYLAVSFCWLMGLMGFVRSGLRQHWHVYEIVQDVTPHAFTPPIGFAANVITLVVLVFFAMVGMIFWISSLAAHRPEPASA